MAALAPVWNCNARTHVARWGLGGVEDQAQEPRSPGGSLGPKREEQDIAWQIVVEQISSESRNHLEIFKDIQKNSLLLQHAKYKFLPEGPPQEKSEYVRHRTHSGKSFLLGQTAPISLIPNFFHSQENYFTSKDTCYQEEEGEEEENLSKPDNSPTKIYTDMMVKSSHFPEHAYFLNESYFEIQYPIPGNIYTLILDQLHKVNQIQVLTGIGKLGIYQLKQRQVELGYDPIQEKKGLSAIPC
eukprot:bmy_19967T0